MSDDGSSDLDLASAKLNSSENLNKALLEIENGSSIGSAAKKFNIPKSTLHRHSQGKIKLGYSQPRSLISPESEEQLVKWLVESAEMGDPKTRKQLISAASEIVLLENKTVKGESLTSGWLAGFMQRHPEISLRTPQAVTKASAKVSEGDIRRFFEKIFGWIDSKGFSHCLDDAARFLNCDETGFQLNPPPDKVFAKKGSKNVNYIESSNPKSRISAMYTFGADGHSYKPQLIMRSGLRKLPQVLQALGGKKMHLN